VETETGVERTGEACMCSGELLLAAASAANGEAMVNYFLHHLTNLLLTEQVVRLFSTARTSWCEHGIECAAQACSSQTDGRQAR
jgi:hypothetical protein